jgi:hypothetical protein
VNKRLPLCGSGYCVRCVRNSDRFLSTTIEISPGGGSSRAKSVAITPQNEGGSSFPVDEGAPGAWRPSQEDLHRCTRVRQRPRWQILQKPLSRNPTVGRSCALRTATSAAQGAQRAARALNDRAARSARGISGFMVRRSRARVGVGSARGVERPVRARSRDRWGSVCAGRSVSFTVTDRFVADYLGPGSANGLNRSRGSPSFRRLGSSGA